MQLLRTKNYLTIAWADLMGPDLLADVTIVIVEDYDDARAYLDLFLKRSGANVVLAKNAFEGIVAVKKNRPDVVLCDIAMPERDGFDLLRDIRALGAEAGGGVPVTAMTALISRRERARMVDLGFQACLSKPFAPDELRETIVQVLNG
jgi:CheY-like chemotaxis protein